MISIFEPDSSHCFRMFRTKYIRIETNKREKNGAFVLITCTVNILKWFTFWFVVENVLLYCSIIASNTQEIMSDDHEHVRGVYGRCAPFLLLIANALRRHFNPRLVFSTPASVLALITLASSKAQYPHFSSIKSRIYH